MQKLAQALWAAENSEDAEVLERGLLFRCVPLDALLWNPEEPDTGSLDRLLLYSPGCQQASAWSWGARDCVPYILRPNQLVLVADVRKLWPWIRVLYPLDGHSAARCSVWEKASKTRLLNFRTVPCLEPDQVGRLTSWSADPRTTDGQALLTGAPWRNIKCSKVQKLESDVQDPLSDLRDKETDPRPTTLVNLSKPGVQWQESPASAKALLRKVKRELRCGTSTSSGMTSNAFRARVAQRDEAASALFPQLES
jgi:hypothetical protein